MATSPPTVVTRQAVCCASSRSRTGGSLSNTTAGTASLARPIARDTKSPTKYDHRGRLVGVKRNGAVTHRYAYTERDEMATIVEPGIDIENTFDENGRCIRQTNRHGDGSEPYVFDFTYRVEGSEIVQTDSRRSDGTWVRYAFKDGRTIAETRAVRDISQSRSFLIAI